MHRDLAALSADRVNLDDERFDALLNVVDGFDDSSDRNCYPQQ